MLEAKFIKKLPEFTLSVDITAADEILVLSGPSGSGKTTILDCLAGIQKPDRGTIYQDGKVLFSSYDSINIHPSQRGMGYIFQDCALFQHLQVKDNILYGWRTRKNQNTSISPEEVAVMLKIDHLMNRYPAQLSGGEKQRAALARGLLSRPSLLLLDEPLSSLDEDLRNDLRGELRQIHHKLRLPFILVTHSELEARLGKVVLLAEKSDVSTGKPIISFKRNSNKLSLRKNKTIINPQPINSSLVKMLSER